MGQIDKYLIKGGFLKELKTVQQLRLSKNNRDSKMLKIEPSALIEKINLVVKEINREV